MYIQNKSITVQIIEIHSPDRITSLQNCQTKAKIIILFTRLCVAFTHKEDTAVHSLAITQTLPLLYLHNSHFKGGLNNFHKRRNAHVKRNAEEIKS